MYIIKYNHDEISPTTNDNHCNVYRDYINFCGLNNLDVNTTHLIVNGNLQDINMIGLLINERFLNKDDVALYLDGSNNEVYFNEKGELYDIDQYGRVIPIKISMKGNNYGK